VDAFVTFGALTREGAEEVPIVTEHTLTTPRHTTFYLACGPQDGTPIIFLHGWPELSLSWRHQLPVFGALGFRAIAPAWTISPMQNTP